MRDTECVLLPHFVPNGTNKYNYLYCFYPQVVPIGTWNGAHSVPDAILGKDMNRPVRDGIWVKTHITNRRKRPVRDEIWIEISLRQIKNRPGRDGMWVETYITNRKIRAVRDEMYMRYGNMVSFTFRTERHEQIQRPPLFLPTGCPYRDEIPPYGRNDHSPSRDERVYVYGKAANVSPTQKRHFQQPGKPLV